MARFVVLLLLGAIAGAAAVWLVRGAGEPAPGMPAGPSTSSLQPAPAGLPDPTAPRSEPGIGSDFAAARLAALEQAAAVDDSFDLESLIRNEARQPRSRLRDMRLEALLARHAELDPAAAFMLALRLSLDTDFVLPVFEAWLAADADAAIDELFHVRPPARQRELALAALRVVGNDAGVLERIAAALPQSSRGGFEMDALVDRSREDPLSALRQLLAMDRNALQASALNDIARMAATRDPHATLALIEGIDDRSLRTMVANAALGAWSQSDPAAAFAWLEQADVSQLQDSAGVFAALAQNDPERLMALARTWPGTAGTNALRLALQQVASRDAQAALAMLTQVPPGADRDTLLATIGQAYGRQDPEQALAWLETLGPSVNTVRASVIRGIAETDIDRALDIVVADIESTGTGIAGLTSISSLSMAMTLSTIGGSDNAERIIDRLIGIDNPAADSAVTTVMSRWAQTDTEAALNWTLRNSARVSGTALTRLAQEIAASDVSLAMATMSQFPPAQRADWLEGLAIGVAGRDVNEALSLLNSFQGQPGYAGAYGAVANQMAQSDPVAAANLLSAAPAAAGPELSSAVTTVAATWSRSDPAAAAAWAAGLPDSISRPTSLGMVARNWADRDPGAARDWALGLARGPSRDAALSGYLSAAAQRGEFDPRLLDAFSGPQQAQQAAMGAIVTFGRTDAEAARAIIDAHITDPAMRRSAHEMLARTGGAGFNQLIGTSGTVILP